MHIGFIEDTHLHGGTQIWVTEAIRAFLARGQDVTLLAPTESWVVKQCEDTGARIRTYNWDDVVNEKPEDQAIWTEALAPCDVAVCTVHPPRHGFHCSVFAGKCIKEGGLDTHLIPKTGTIVPEYKREFYLPEPTINSSVIAIADFTRQYLLEAYHLPADGVYLVYQGTDLEAFHSTPEGKAEALQRYPLPEDAAPVLGCVGSFEPRKGQPVLFDAVARLASGRLPNVHLILVGDGPDEAMLRERIKMMKMENHITIYPFTREPIYIFERIDMTVLASLYKEGLPNVLLESLAMNVPAVSTDLGGVREAIVDGKTGYVVEPGDSDQLADAIERLWSDQEAYRGMKKEIRAFVEERFDKNRQFDRFLEHFKTLI